MSDAKQATSSGLPPCSQSGCLDGGIYRYTWPGKDEAHVCETHARKLRQVAGALGLYLQLQPMTTAEVIRGR